VGFTDAGSTKERKKMETRYFVVPADVPVVSVSGMKCLDSITNKPATAVCVDFLRGRLGDNAKFGRSMTTISLQTEWVIALRGKKPHSVVEISSNAWQLMCEAINEPSTPYAADVIASWQPHMDAVLGAGTKPPENAKVHTLKRRGKAH
jgi:hypothetical protein